MRQLALFALIVSVGWAVPALGQPADGDDETLIGSVQQSGGYGAPTVAITSVNDQVAAIVGGQGGWVINNRFVIGGAGRGLASRPSTSFRGEAADVQMGYGGLLLEYIGASSELVHYGGSVVIGGGAAQIVDEDFVDFRDDSPLNQSGFFVTEAGPWMELNVTSFFRLSLGGGYRLIRGADLRGASDDSLSGPYGQLSFRFGSF